MATSEGLKSARLPWGVTLMERAAGCAPCTGRDVTVVVPMKNAAAFLGMTLRSILSQTTPPHQVVVVDDGSTDGSLAIARATGARDVRVKVVSNLDRPGHEGARNCGVALAETAWIAECDADDVWMPTKLQRQIEYINNWHAPEPYRELVALGTAGITVNARGWRLSTLDVGVTTVAEYEGHLRNGIPVEMHHSSVLYTKSAFKRAGGYRYDYVGAEDLDLWSRMMEIGVIININEPLFLYRKHATSYSFLRTKEQALNQDRACENMRRRRQELHELTLDEYRSILYATLTPEDRRRFDRRVEAKRLYRSGAIRLANGRLSGIGALVRAAIMDWSRVQMGLRRIFALKLPSLRGRS